MYRHCRLYRMHPKRFSEECEATESAAWRPSWPMKELGRFQRDAPVEPSDQMWYETAE